MPATPGSNILPDSSQVTMKIDPLQPIQLAILPNSQALLPSNQAMLPSNQDILPSNQPIAPSNQGVHVSNQQQVGSHLVYVIS